MMGGVGERGFQRLAAITAIASAVAAVASGALSLAVVPASTSPDYWAGVLARGTGAAGLLRFAMVLDVFGYYLLLAPLALFLRTWLGSAQPDLARLYTIAALAYMLLGALGATILAAVLPSLMADYVHASTQHRETLQVVFNAVVSAVDRGIWNMLEMVPAATWLLGIGWLLRGQRQKLGIGAMVVGVAALLDGVGTVLGVPAIALPGLGILLLGLPLWALAMGVDMLRASSGEARA